MSAETAPLRARDRLRVRWAPRWSDSIADLVSGLPLGRMCSAELYAAMLERSIAGGGRIAIVERRGEPIAVVGLQRDGRLRWKLVANWIIPDLICAGADHDVLPALSALRTEISVMWWRRDSEPSHPAIRRRQHVPTHILRVDEREAYWRSTGRWRGVVGARNKCAGLTITLNEPGGYEWVARSAAEKFTAEAERQYLTIDEQLLALEHLEARGQHVTLVLRDGERRLSGEACIIDGSTLVSVLAYRDESVGSLPTGVRTMDEIFEYADSHGLTEVDLGGSRPYKHAWAPESGSHDELLVGPALRYRGRELARRLLARG